MGRAVASRLAQEGATVAICGRSAVAVQQAVQMIAASGGKIVGVEADVSKLASVQQLVAFLDRELGGLDILVNNAGIAVLCPVADLNPEQWQQTLATNLSAAFYCRWEVIPRFRKRGGGFIINIGSPLGKTAVAGGAAYCASKFDLMASVKP